VWCFHFGWMLWKQYNILLCSGNNFLLKL
jgi:hypothetical protein